MHISARVCRNGIALYISGFAVATLINSPKNSRTYGPFISSALALEQPAVIAQTTANELLVETDRLLDEGWQQMKSGQYQAAIAAYESAISSARSIGSQPQEAEALMGVGTVYALLGNHQQSISSHGQALSILQSAILMSFWDGDSGQVRDSYHWVGIATLHANGIGLHCDPMTMSCSKHRQRMLRRTWWSLLIRDRLLAVTMRRPVQIKSSRFDVPMLQVEDFEIDSFLEAAQSFLKMGDVASTERETLASCCIAVAQLSEYIDKVLAMQYSVQKTTRIRQHQTLVVTLIPKTTDLNWVVITNCGQELQSWYGYLPIEVQRLHQATPEQRNALKVMRSRYTKPCSLLTIR